MRPYILAESNWKEIKKQSVELAILPWGATEAHNYHLPYYTDVYEGDAIGMESAKKAWEKGAKVMLLPTVPFGVNTGQRDIKLDLNMYPSTQMAVLNDLVEVLNRQGIYKLLILNSHGGNDFKTLLRELGAKYPKMWLATCSWFKILDHSTYFETPGDHADEMETSLMMHLRPDLVRPLSEAGAGHERKSKIAAMREGWLWAERPWSKISADTGVGDPKSATSEKGALFFEAVTTKLAAMYLEVCQADMTDLYE
jgi:creatinine amidohydrolase